MSMTSTLRVLGLTLCLPVLASCGARNADVSTPQYDSAVNVALDGTIDAGVVLTDTDEDGAVLGQIREQLHYALGQLNGQGGGVDLAHAEITIGTKTVLSPTRWRVTYQAKLFVSWPREYQIPASYTLVLPARGDAAGRQRFVETYGADEAGRKLCLADDAHGIGTGSFWYYYRPFKTRCPLARAVNAQITRVALKLKRSDENTTGKSPEYGKIWEDGKLVITAVFSKYEEGATADGDAGIAAYRQAYDTFVATYGAPVTTTLPSRGRPSAANADIRLVFNSPAGQVDVAMFLLDSVTGASPEFVEIYEKRTETADFISYDGHAGLGANIRALTRMGKYLPGQYQIFLLNGCDTFAYVDDNLKIAHQAANPESGPDRFVDVIANARPSMFSQMTRATMAVATALGTKTKTYRQILAGFDGNQRASVDGEHDNRWPLPFD